MKKARIQEFKNKKWNTLFTLEAETEEGSVAFYQDSGLLVVYRDSYIFSVCEVYRIKGGQRALLEE